MSFTHVVLQAAYLSSCHRQRQGENVQARHWKTAGGHSFGLYTKLGHVLSSVRVSPITRERKGTVKYIQVMEFTV